MISQIWTLAFALFAMFFGAANLVFPLVVGLESGEAFPYALMGFYLTAVLLPFIGLYTSVVLRGSYRLFFSPLGRWGGACAAGAILALLGPFGVIPRCIALSEATFHHYFPYGSVWSFDLIAAIVMALLAWRPGSIVVILGRILTPLLLISLGVVMVAGLIQAPGAAPVILSSGDALWLGTFKGYQTMDLLAALFFASFVVDGLKGEGLSWGAGVASMVLAALLLVGVYAGFAALAALYAPMLQGVPSTDLLGAIAVYALGPWAGAAMSIIVCLACMTTALSLAGIFARYVSDEFSVVSYGQALCLTAVIAFGFSTLEFNGIVNFLAPILSVGYPWLIALTAWNWFSSLRYGSDEQLLIDGS